MTGSSSSSTTTAHSSIGLGQQQHAGYQYTLLPVSESTAASATTTTGTTTIRHSGSMGWWAGSSYQRAIVCLILLFVCMQFLLNLSTTSSASPSAAGLLSLTGREMPFPDHRKHWLSLEEMDGSSSESIAGGGRRVGMSRGYLSRADYVYPAVVAGDGLPDPASNSSHGTEVPIKDCPLVPPKLGEHLLPSSRSSSSRSHFRSHAISVRFLVSDVEVRVCECVYAQQQHPLLVPILMHALILRSSCAWSVCCASACAFFLPACMCVCASVPRQTFDDRFRRRRHLKADGSQSESRRSWKRNERTREGSDDDVVVADGDCLIRRWIASHPAPDKYSR